MAGCQVSSSLRVLPSALAARFSVARMTLSLSGSSRRCDRAMSVEKRRSSCTAASNPGVSSVPHRAGCSATVPSTFAHVPHLTGHANCHEKPVIIGAPSRIRTCGLCLRRATLYPAELWVLLGSVIPHKRGGGKWFDRKTHAARRPVRASDRNPRREISPPDFSTDFSPDFRYISATAN